MDKTTKKMDIGNLINQAWELTKKHFPIFLLLLILGQAIGSLPSYGYYSENMMAIINGDVPMTEDEWIEHYVSSSGNFSGIFSFVFLYLVAALGGFYVSLVTYRILNDAIEGKKVDLTAQLKESFSYFFFFAGAYIVFSFSMALGMVCCILPGIYLGIRWIFVPFIAANNRDISFSEVFGRSWQMTKGHFWELLLLGIVVIGINLVGFACCCVGLFVTCIISTMLYGLAYKALLPSSDESSPITE